MQDPVAASLCCIAAGLSKANEQASLKTVVITLATADMPAAGNAQGDHPLAAEVQGGVGYHHCQFCQPLGVSQLGSLPG